MAKTVHVTSAQRRAAKTIVERSAVTGRYVRPGVAKIAESTPKSHARSALYRAGTSRSRPRLRASKPIQSGSVVKLI